MRTLVLGLGNPYLGDDGVGWRVIDELEKQFREAPHSGVELDRASLGGIALMERLVGFDRAIIVDSFQMQGNAPGQWRRLSLADLPTLYTNNAHDASLKDALQLGRQLGAALPEEIILYAVDISKGWDFADRLSPEVERAVIPVACQILSVLKTDRAA